MTGSETSQPANCRELGHGHPKAVFPQWLLMAAAYALKNVTWLRRVAIRWWCWKLGIRQGAERAKLEHLIHRVATQLSPRAAAGLLRVVSAQSATNATMPRTFFMSITNKCNLRCKQCYAAGWDRRSGLTEEQIEQVVRDCHENGVDIFTLLGGEPFTRKRLIFSLLRKHPDCLFMVNSNGLLITEKVADRLAHFGNVVVHLSLEGGALRTDRRRGSGTYAGVLAAMDRLRKRGVPFDVTAMVTTENMEEITSDGFLEELLEHGALAVWYTCYRPVGGEYDNELVVPYADRAALFRKIVRLRNRMAIALFDNQFDYAMFGGCFATLGLNTHLNSYGCIEPCPAMHYSTDNLLSTGTTVPELYSSSRLLRAVRSLHDPSFVRCPITDATGQLMAALGETGAKDSTDNGDFKALERFAAHTSACRTGARPGASLITAQDVYEPIKAKLLCHLFGQRLSDRQAAGRHSGRETTGDRSAA